VLAELVGDWPKIVGVILICLIPKSDGGRRPIGLFPSVIRLWMRIRLEVAKQWQSVNDRGFFYAGPAKGANVASWKQAARAELASFSHIFEFVCALLDLVKAFDRVPFDWLVANAIEYEYPIRILRLSIQAYLLGRVIVIECVCSRVLFASRGITAGSVLATIELRVLLIRSMDRLVYRFPSVIATVYVDDTSLETTGSPAQAIKDIVGSTKFLVSEFDDMRLELSATKNQCLASRPCICGMVAAAVPRAHFKAVTVAKSLGVAIVAGCRRHTGIIKKRLAVFKARRQLYRRVRRAIGARKTHNLLRTGGLPALVYGQATTGVSTCHLLDQRRAVAAAGVAGGAGDLDMSLAIIDGSLKGRADPAFAAHADPIGSFAEAVWCEWLPRQALLSLVSHAIDVLGSARSPWGRVRGPGAAFVASAQRLGWTIVDAFSCTDDRGHLICLSRDSPAMIRLLTDASVRRWRWRRVEEKCPSLIQGAGGFGAHIVPSYRIINARKPPAPGWGHQQTGALCSAIMNRQWTQCRLVSAGLASGISCRLCVAAGYCTKDSIQPKFKGTLVHRLWTCPCTESMRVRLVPGWLLRKVRGLLQPDFSLPPHAMLLYTRALHPSLEPRIAQPLDESFEWDIPPPSEGIPHGRVYVDGSRLFAEHKYCGLLARQGWAFAVCDVRGKVVASASGRTPWWSQGIFAAELRALLNASLLAFPGSPFVVDCMAVRLGSSNGLAYAAAPNRVLGRSWIPVANVIADTSSHVIWMPAHCSVAAVGRAKLSDGRLLSVFDLHCNSYVDEIAKGAAGEHAPSREDRQLVLTATNLVHHIALWIGQCTAIANHFPIVDLPSGPLQCEQSSARAKFIRDSDAKRVKCKANVLTRVKATKRKDPPLPVASVPCPAVRNVDRPMLLSSMPSHNVSIESHGTSHLPAQKRRRVSELQVQNRLDDVFHQYWLANQAGRVQSQPAVSGKDRLEALRARIASRVSLS
jgi:hypothetical protein